MAQKSPQAHDFTNAMDPRAPLPMSVWLQPECAGRKWTFKAVDGVRIPDEDAPVLLKVTTTVTKVNDAADPVRVSGTVTLQFTRPSTTSTIPAIRTPSGPSSSAMWSKQKEVGVPESGQPESEQFEVQQGIGQYHQHHYAGFLG